MFVFCAAAGATEPWGHGATGPRGRLGNKRQPRAVAGFTCMTTRLAAGCDRAVAHTERIICEASY